MMEVEVITATRRKFRWALLSEGALTGLTLGAALAAAGVRFHLASLSLIPLAVIVSICRALRRVPSRATCAALAEDASHAGGLLLVADLPGADAWPLPPVTTPEVPSLGRRRLPGCALALLILALVLALPDRWFASAEPAPARPALTAVTSELKNELDDLAAAEELPTKELEALREELARVEESAVATDPGAALDAVDRLAVRLQTLLELNAETLKRLRRDEATPSDLASSPEAQQALREMIEQSGMGVSLKGEESPEEGEVGGGVGEGEGEEGDGSGGVGRGRDDAPMTWGAESEMEASHFADRTEDVTPASAEIVKVGEVLSAEDPTAHYEGPAALNRPVPTPHAHAPRGLTRHETISPRHRGTVKRFFETERTQP